MIAQRFDGHCSYKGLVVGRGITSREDVVGVVTSVHLSSGLALTELKRVAPTLANLEFANCKF